MEAKRGLIAKIIHGNLVFQIIIGIVLGVIVASLSNEVAQAVSIFGSLFVGALKAIAPILVFVLVSTAIATKEVGTSSNMKPIIVLYLIGTFLAALIAVVASFLFPVDLVLIDATTNNLNPPDSVISVLKGVLFNMVDNPVNALATGNFIGILVWAIALGVAMHYSSQDTKNVSSDIAHGVTKIVRFIIRLAPLGIFGLVANTFSKTGFGALLGYGKLLLVLVGTMLFIAFIVNPIIVFIKERKILIHLFLHV